MTVAIQDQTEHSLDGRLDQRAEAYELYGLIVRSEVQLPCPVRSPGKDEGVAWEIILHAGDRLHVDADASVASQRACDRSCHGGAAYSWIKRSPTGTWFWWERAGLCFVPASNDRVEVCPEPGYSPRALMLMLIGQVAGFLMARRGIPSLHASAVVIDGQAVAFLAPSGHGKSTLAAGLVRRGASLLTDDVLPLVQSDGVIVGRPSLPMMKVWHDTAHRAFDLAIAPKTETNNSGLVEKPLVTDPTQLRFADSPSPLRAIYVVNRFDPNVCGTSDVRSERLSPREALTALLAQTYRGDILTPTEMAGMLSLYARLAGQAPIRRLSYPTGFDRQEATQARILSELGLP